MNPAHSVRSLLKWSEITKRERAIEARQAGQARNPVKNSDLSDKVADKSDHKRDTPTARLASATPGGRVSAPFSVSKLWNSVRLLGQSIHCLQ